ncbi:MAG: hypothetical protein K6U87_14380 [Firmicutes bacterium]|nr:hypothetical protein [Bacillota bacterium]
MAREVCCEVFAEALGTFIEPNPDYDPERTRRAGALGRGLGPFPDWACRYALVGGAVYRPLAFCPFCGRRLVSN